MHLRATVAISITEEYMENFLSTISETVKGKVFMKVIK